MISSFDVFIIGGGPAGLTLAIRLLQMGYSVALGESMIFPRPHIGESLSPGVLNILQYLGATRILDKSVIQHDVTSFLFWNVKYKGNQDSSKSASHLIVDRGTFDTELMSFALSLGLKLFQPVKIKKYEKIANGWKIASGDDYHRAKILVDARGRNGIQKNRFETALPLVALYADFSTDSISNFSVVEAVPNGWLYGTPTCRSDYRVMAFTDPDQLKLQKPISLFAELIKNTFLQERIVAGKSFTQPKSCLVLTYVNKIPWAECFLCLGDAAFTLDPLSSTGVEKAMRFSLQAAIALNTFFQTGDENLSKNFFEDKIIETAIQHNHWSHRYYATAWPSGNNTFWDKRSARNTWSIETSNYPFVSKLNSQTLSYKYISESEIQKPVVTNYFNFWNSSFYITKELTVKRTICVSGELLINHLAYNHPNLNGDIAFLDGHDLSKLFDVSKNANTLLDLLLKWTDYIGYGSAERIIKFLWSKEILLENPN